METLFRLKKIFPRKFCSFINKIIVTALFFFISFVPPGFANEGKLMLDKILMDFNLAVGDSACDEIMSIDSGKDVEDMRQYRCYHRTGKYTMALIGPAGTLVTLFGKYSFNKERGYLIVRKKDDKLVWILDLEDFPHRRWVNSIATTDSGAYDTFYSSAPIFEQNVSSIKWDHWWNGKEPSE